MAINLLNLEPQSISKNLKGKFTLLYGLEKSGKTSLASEIEDVLIASFESGTNALHHVRVYPMKKWKDWKDIVKQLVRDKDKEFGDGSGRTLQEVMSVIAIDTVDEAYKLAERYVCNQQGIDNIKDIPFGGGYKLLDDEFMSGFRELAFEGYGLFFISHSSEKTFKDDNGQDYTKIVPALPNRPYNLINKMVDNIVYLRDIPIQNGDVIEHKRFLFFRGDDRFLAGSRFKYIVPRVELSYDNLLKAINDAVDEEIKHKGGEATNDANPYLERGFEELMEEARGLWTKVVSQDKTKQALDILEKEFGKPTKFSEITSEQSELLQKVLLEIKELL